MLLVESTRFRPVIVNSALKCSLLAGIRVKSVSPVAWPD